MACFSLTAFIKVQKERNDLKEELISKKEKQLNILENIPLVYFAKNENVCLEENTRSVVGLSLLDDTSRNIGSLNRRGKRIKWRKDVEFLRSYRTGPWSYLDVSV